MSRFLRTGNESLAQLVNVRGIIFFFHQNDGRDEKSPHDILTIDVVLAKSGGPWPAGLKHGVRITC